MTFLEIARLEERRQALGTKAVATEAEAIAGGWACYAGPGSWANQAAGMGLDGPVPAAEVARLVTFYTSRGVQPKVELCPFVDPSLLEGLAAHGFSVRGFENVLARELPGGEDLRAALPDGWPADLEIVRVDPRDEAQVRTFIDVSTSGFRPEGQPPSAVEIELTSRVVAHPNCDSFLALLGGRFAGGGGMAVGASVAALFGTSVLPAYRRRGIQQALIVRRLERARERDCRIATIGSEPGISTERNASRVGFFLAYSKTILTLRREGLVPSP